MLERGKAGQIKKRPLKRCDYFDCKDGLVVGLFGSASECTQCGGFGYIDASTGEALPANEIIRQLLLRLVEEKRKSAEFSHSNGKLRERLDKYERSR